MRTKESKKLARQLMNRHGLQDFSLEFLKLKSPIGAASVHYKKIILSAPCLSINSRQWVENVILHEIAHILVWDKVKAAHGDIWKAKAIEIGCNGNIYEDGGIQPTGRYKAVCPVCEKTYYRYEFTLSRHGKVVRNSDEYLERLLSVTFNCRTVGCGGNLKYVDLRSRLNWLTGSWFYKRKNNESQI
jgi:predicted SprT family Zn-dependent metalloprotease